MSNRDHQRPGYAQSREAAGPRRNKPQPAPKPSTQIAITWCAGKQATVNDTDEIFFKGFFTDAGIDADLDASAEAAGMQRATMEHQNKRSGGIRYADHWLFPNPCNLFILIAGLPYILDGDDQKALNANLMSMVATQEKTAEHGIRARWPQGQRSSLAVMALPALLLQNGYAKPLSLAANSTATADLLLALHSHNEHLDRVGVLARQKAEKEGWTRQKEPNRYFPGDSFYDLALPFIAGQKDTRGSGDLVSSVFPMRSGHKADSTRADYARLFDASGTVARIVGEYWDSIVGWAAYQWEGNRDERR